ncbi:MULTISPECIES: DEAD/DEAH box helicase [unclassified Vibrio]|uniref:DEAD/DEAH box helicase n=1 Tax=unclassified Vibrio TaxID=2614977 RepID=UPI0014824C85|nr:MULTISPECIES: DEAD/DEAH box helicase [unclassified Vibrio]NNN43486.1 DEAD/DEAH box helicase [Vibrio sp. 1-1(7)]NNN71310.1 DEAD/DEAH box helicase [Vibrio sp. 12-2(3-a)]
MSRTAQLTWQKNDDGFLFQVSHEGLILPPSQWSRYSLIMGDTHVVVDPLFRGIEDVPTPLISDAGITCSDQFIASLTEVEIQKLCLPPVSHAKVKIVAKGLISQPNFQLSYRLMAPEGRPMMGAKVAGIELKHRGQTELILDPLYSIITKIDQFNSTNILDQDERFVRWGEIKELLPDDSVVDGQLQNITICRADRVTLDIKEHGIFNPLLIKSNPTKDWDIQGQSDVEYAIPKARQKKFEDHFKAWSTTRSNYAIGNGVYVVLPLRVQKVLSVIKDYQTKDSQERLAFVSNPHKIINERLDLEDNPEDLDSIFVETPDFISQRIDTIGVWSPKLCAYVAKREGDWVPDDDERLFFPVDDLLVNFTVDEMKHLLGEINIALDNEVSEISFEGQRVPVSLETKNLLIKILKPFDEHIGPPDAPLEVLAPIVKDNIEEVEFEVIKHNARPKLPKLPKALKTKSLYEHQKFGVEWLADHWESGSIGALLADDMGLGKTMQALAFLASVKELMNDNHYPTKPFLIVAPSGLLKNWRDEASLHIEEGGLGDVFEAFGAQMRDIKTYSVVERNSLLSGSGWVLTTYETLRDKIKYFLSIDWGITIFDEAQKIKNPVSRMTEMAKSLSSDFTLMLTGTPVENELKDLWCIVDTAQPGLFGSLSQFHNEYAKPAESDPSEAQRLKSLLVEKSNPPLMLRRLKEDHLEGLPQKLIHQVAKPMPELQAAEYENIVRDAQLRKGMAGGVLETIQKIRRASLIAEEFDGNGITDGVVKRSARLTALIEILDNVHKSGEKALVFCEAIDVQEYLSGYLQHRYQLPSRPHRINGSVDGYTRKQYVDDFQSGAVGDFDVMLLSPKAGGVGLTITAANHVIHLTRWWNPAVEDQSTDRAFRIGQKKDVNVYIPMAIHPKYKDASFDANLNRLLSKKRSLSYNALMPGTITKDEMKDLISQSVV